MDQIQTKYRPPLPEVMAYMPPPLHENANALKYIGFQPIPDKEKIQIVVTEAFSPDFAFAHLAEGKSYHKLEKQTIRMTEYYERRKADKQFLEELTIGGACVCRFGVDNRFYRAIVISKKPKIFGSIADDHNDFIYLVWYIDYGNVDQILHKDDIHELYDVYKKLPAQAIPICFPKLKQQTNSVFQRDFYKAMKTLGCLSDTQPFYVTLKRLPNEKFERFEKKMQRGRFNVTFDILVLEITKKCHIYDISVTFSNGGAGNHS